MKNIIVTGSSGTVGTAVCEKLLDESYRLFCVDAKPNPHNPAVNDITTITDLTRLDDVHANLPSNAGVILHFAGHARVPHSINNPKLARDNLEMTYNILEFARAQGIRKLLFASSKDVYGNAQMHYAEDEARIEACESPYAASKIACEALLHAYEKCFGIEFITLRLANVYGRYDEGDRLIPLFIRLTRENRDITVNGAEKLLDFVHIDDVTEAVWLSLKYFREAKNQTYNIASGRGTSLVEIAEIIRRNLNGSNKILINKSQAGDVVQSVSDISKAARFLNYQPRVDMQSGLLKTIEYLNRKEVS